MNLFLRPSSLFDSVYSRTTERPLSIKRRVLRGLLTCRHRARLAYKRVDYRPGPGWMSDSYEGIVCIECGRVMEERRTY